MFKLMLSFGLLSLTSCMKLNLKEKNKSDKNGYTSLGGNGSIGTEKNLSVIARVCIKGKTK